MSQVLNELFETILDRQANPTPDSYTAKLLSEGVDTSLIGGAGEGDIALPGMGGHQGAEGGLGDEFVTNPILRPLDGGWPILRGEQALDEQSHFLRIGVLKTIAFRLNPLFVETG